MRKRLMYMLLIGACIGSIGPAADRAAGGQTGQRPLVKNMDITGEIAKMDYGYIIRGKVPAEIFTILNPVPGTLDKLVKSGKIVHLRVKIVSGDNVEIELIDGKAYHPSAPGGKTKQNGKKKEATSSR